MPYYIVGYNDGSHEEIHALDMLYLLSELNRQGKRLSISFVIDKSKLELTQTIVDRIIKRQEEQENFFKYIK